MLRDGLDALRAQHPSTALRFPNFWSSASPGGASPPQGCVYSPGFIIQADHSWPPDPAAFRIGVTTNRSARSGRAAAVNAAATF